jgi:hypothetical protein
MFKSCISLLLAVVAFAASADQFEVDQLYARVKKGEATEAQLDKACAQKDCITSRLYWYTDLEEAKRAARQTGRPIVALHLLGRLDEELSCANSRFFRTTLYSDESVASLLRDDFILFWHSVRPVPRITIEFGDGRTIQQTITGNSAHYLLAPDGAVLDALPGLYSPAEFRAQLGRWTELNRRMAGRRDAQDVLREYHRQRIDALKERWSQLSDRTGIRVKPTRVVKAMTAQEATVRTMSKAGIDRPLLASMQLAQSLRALPPSDWEYIGLFEARQVQFSRPAIDLIRQKQFGTAKPKRGELEALIENLQASVAGDTIFNECELHAAIHGWFARGEVTDLASLNTRVYEELFLTPESDPWLGLKSPTIFTAIEAN